MGIQIALEKHRPLRGYPNFLRSYISVTLDYIHKHRHRSCVEIQKTCSICQFPESAYHHQLTQPFYSYCPAVDKRVLIMGSSRHLLFEIPKSGT